MLSEVQELRALAHPLRIALLELLALKGALTATEASKVIGGTPANSAYHLRTLAKHGYVVEAEGGVGRERPWRLGTLGMSFSDDDSDPAVSNAARALAGVLSERWISRAKYFRAHRDSYPAEVRRVSGESQFVVYATEAEIDAAQEEVMATLIRYQDRISDPAKRPEGARAYELIVSTHPFDLALFAGADGCDENDGENDNENDDGDSDGDGDGDGDGYGDEENNEDDYENQ
jgi:DNA-binding transcriptional ArsR family regulator